MKLGSYVRVVDETRGVIVSVLVFSFKVHKLISSSTYLMFPGPQNISHCTPASARVYSYHDPSSANPPAPSFGAVGNNGNARSSEACIRSCPNSGGDLGVLSGNQGNSTPILAIGLVWHLIFKLSWPLQILKLPWLID